MDLTAYIRDVPDFPKPGILFKDITPLLAAPEAFKASVDMIADAVAGVGFDTVAAAEARGFLFAAPLAVKLGKPLVPLRKPGKLPYESLSVEYDLEYGTDALHMHTDAVGEGHTVLLVDDLLATGGTMKAACELVEKAGGRVAGCAFVIELGFLNGRGKLRGQEIFSLLNITDGD